MTNLKKKIKATPLELSGLKLTIASKRIRALSGDITDDRKPSLA